jgi:hypothetical protein
LEPVSCGHPKQSLLGPCVAIGVGSIRIYLVLTFGGDRINNPGRYFLLLPPINGATAASGTPYFTVIAQT